MNEYYIVTLDDLRRLAVDPSSGVVRIEGAEEIARLSADLAAAREAIRQIVSAHDDANVETPAEDIAEYMADIARAFLERTKTGGNGDV